MSIAVTVIEYGMVLVKPVRVKDRVGLITFVTGEAWSPVGPTYSIRQVLEGGRDVFTVQVRTIV